MTIPEYPAELKERVVRWLERAPRGSQKTIADALEVSERTLWNWKKSYGQRKRRGPKPAPRTVIEKIRIAREWKRQAKCGTRSVIKELPGVKVALVREVIRELKLRDRTRTRKRQESVRVSVTVKKVGVVVAMDGTMIRKGEDLIVVRDRGSLGVAATRCNGPLRSEHTLSELEKMKVLGQLPLVVCTDNGSPFCSKLVQDYMAANYVTHLRSLPHVSQHNPSAENANGEIKPLVHLGVSEEKACRALNEGRKRRSLGYKTSAEIDKERRVTYTDEDRLNYYNKTKAAIEVAVLGTKVGRERRKAEREAILATLEGSGLITRTRGGQTRASNR